MCNRVQPFDGLQKRSGQRDELIGSQSGPLASEIFERRQPSGKRLHHAGRIVIFERRASAFRRCRMLHRCLAFQPRGRIRQTRHRGDERVDDRARLARDGLATLGRSCEPAATCPRASFC